MLVRRLAAVAVVALALSSCSEDPVKPKPLEQDSSSSSPTSSPSGTPKSESAEEFIRRWMEAEDRMQGTGDTEAYRAFTSHCVSCDSLADHVDRIYESGGYIKFEGTRILAITRTGGSRRELTFEMRLRSGATTYVEEEGGPVKSLTGDTDTHQVILERKNDAWLVTSTGELAE